MNVVLSCALSSFTLLNAHKIHLFVVNGNWSCRKCHTDFFHHTIVSVLWMCISIFVLSLFAKLKTWTCFFRPFIVLHGEINLTRKLYFINKIIKTLIWKCTCDAVHCVRIKNSTEYTFAEKIYGHCFCHRCQ